MTKKWKNNGRFYWNLFSIAAARKPPQIKTFETHIYDKVISDRNSKNFIFVLLKISYDSSFRENESGKLFLHKCLNISRKDEEKHVTYPEINFLELDR